MLFRPIERQEYINIDEFLIILQIYKFNFH